MAHGDGPAGPASAVQQFVGGVMEKVTAPIDALNLGVANATLGILQFLPKFPALRLYSDLIFQFGHSHPHPPTFGFPLPSVGPVLAAGCMSVLINGQPAARNGDMGLSVWCGGYVPIFEIFMGSSHVFIGGDRAARAFIDPSYHCLPDPFGGGKATKAMQAVSKLEIAGTIFGIGMSALNVAAAMEKEAQVSEGAAEGQEAADAEIAAAEAAAAGVGVATAAAQLAADIAAAAMGLLMGKDPGVGFPFGLGITGSPNVLVGGFPMPGWSTILKGLFKLIKPVIRKLQLKLKEGSRTRNALCFFSGDPVEVASGRLYSPHVDFDIDGRIPIEFERVYDSSAADYDGPFGLGWTHPYNQLLWESKRDRCLVMRNNENRLVRFDQLEVGEKYFHPMERATLERRSYSYYELRELDSGFTYEFNSTRDGQEVFTEEAPLRLTGITDRNGNRIDLSFNGNELSVIENGSGVSVNLRYQEINGKLRIVEIRENLRNGQSISLINYGYDPEGQLISDTNRTYIPYTYHYQNGLLIKKTTRNGLSFYFEYEGAGPRARCTHTWGDGGIYERYFTYSPEARITRVKDGLGGETVYHYNELDLITKIFDPEGGVQQFEYGDRGELLKETDELGRERIYAYDDLMNCVSVVQEDGTAKRVTFNEFCEPVSVVDEIGAVWTREYDAVGNVVSATNPLNATRTYEYDDRGEIVALTDTLGNVTRFAWAANGEIAEVVLPNGAKTLHRYNERGLLSEVHEEATGLRIQYSYDDVGRISRITELDQRQQALSVEKYEYDANDNLRLYVDALGNKTYYKFAGHDKLYEQVDALGNKKSFTYDVEERLIRITNERGERYLLEYDLNDAVIAETGFDGNRTEHKYNLAGEPVYQKDAMNREMFYRRDAMGRVTRIIRSDQSELLFNYDQGGRMISAKNPHTEVRFAYDALSQVIREEQGDSVIEYEYDSEGNRSSRKLSGNNSRPVKYAYDSIGNLSNVKVAGYEVNFGFDSAGRVSRKQVTGGIEESYTYDISGRLEGQRVAVGANGREIVRRNYSWNAMDNVIEVQDSLRGPRKYSYDALERISKVERIVSGESLPEVKPPGKAESSLPPEKRLWQADAGPRTSGRRSSETERFIYDESGNLLERNSNVRDQVRSKHGLGNKLDRRDGTEYIYDAGGNLIQKRKQNGEVLSYEYDIDNQLISVSGTTGGRIEFRYDALGRRIAKITDKGTTGFLWDGDVLLGEQSDSFQEYIHAGFVPLAKIKAGGVETIHTDYLGTPKEVTDLNGNLLWQGNYDEYGQVTKVRAEVTQNIRFLGQYEDEETGLFYNRFRYYDPESCRYINRDPAELDGGFNFYAYCQNPLMWVDPFGLVGEDFDWGGYLRKKIGDPPAWMKRPHAHHIVFKNGVPAMKKDLAKSKAILKKVGIDYLKGYENLVWAPNAKHSVRSAKIVREQLEAAMRRKPRGKKDTKALQKARVKAALKKLGAKFADGTIYDLEKKPKKKKTC